MNVVTKLYSDGTVTYWSVYKQVWVERVLPWEIPDEEYACMNQEERVRTLAHRPMEDCRRGA